MQPARRAGTATACGGKRKARPAKKAAPVRRRIKKQRISLHNVNTGERINNLLLVREDPKKRHLKYIRTDARKRLNRFFRDRRTGKHARLPDRLLWVLYLVGYHYDRPVEVVSGLRTNARETSRHSQSRAADIRVDGVDAKELWTYCKRFKKVGLGWYPTSKFVHVDIRDKAYYWIDDSGPGEDAQYRENVRQPVAEWKAQKKRGTASRSRKPKRRSRQGTR